MIGRSLTEKYFPQTLHVGDVVYHPNGYKVKIVSGQYMGEHGLSNFWHWKRVLKSGKLSSKEECGYGWDPRIDVKKRTGGNRP
jgi:hypothetical protein